MFRHARSTCLIAGFTASLFAAGCDRPSPETAETAPPTETAAPPAPAGPQVPRRAGANVLIEGARVMTATGVVFESADVLIVDGVIAEVGEEVAAPDGVDVTRISGAGKVVTPGVIDTHSHMGVYASPGLSAHGDGNEIVGPNTAYVRAQDGYWPQDPQLPWALAGGVTTAQILPGSANLIGGRSTTVKLYPGARSAAEAHFPGAPDGLKMACGENPKRVYGEKGGPHTRMGNVAGYRKAFEAGKAYLAKQRRHEEKMAAYEAGEEDERPDPMERDFGLETIAGVLRGEILVHNHCYRADEMLIMLSLAREYGFSIRSFHHAVEAYKIAPELAEAGTAASVWADWWGFKAEAFDGIRENAAVLSAAGGRPVIHSDDAVGIQRLNQEAAKAMFAGRRAGIEIGEDEALRWITAYPAWALGIDGYTGTLEPGKMGDVVIWDGSPFSVYTRAEKVFIEGTLVFDRERGMRPRTDFDVGWPARDPRAPLAPSAQGTPAIPAAKTGAKQ